MFSHADISVDETIFLGLFLESFSYGLYTGLFVIYLQYQTLKKDTWTQNIIFYSICALYVLSTVAFLSDIIVPVCQFLSKPMELSLNISLLQLTLFGCCDFITQLILIYRCWIIWGRNIHVVLIPSLITFAFLATWLAATGSTYISDDQILAPKWGYYMTLTSLTLSLTVNALVTGPIVFRIFKVFRDVKSTSNAKILAITGIGSKLRRTTMILIESGMALFSIQLARIIVTIVLTDNTTKASNVIASIHQMLNGITPTIILVRTSMGLSFHDEKSMEEIASGSLHFASNHPTDSLPETECITAMLGQDSRDDDNLDVQRSTNDIDIVQR